VKIWGIQRFKPSVVEQRNTVHELIDMHKAMISADEHPIGMEHTDIYVYVVNPAQFCAYHILLLYPLLTISL